MNNVRYYTTYKIDMICNNISFIPPSFSRLCEECSFVVIFETGEISFKAVEKLLSKELVAELLFEHLAASFNEGLLFVLLGEAEKKINR